MATKQYQCLSCTGQFTAREADRKRGWARFCSKSCKAKHQEKRTGQFTRYKQRVENDSPMFNQAHLFDNTEL